ncbi:MAG: 1-deoxy-D-xylulose-5-phosphate reductoisomerase [Capsulimonadaceae bacterium]
MKNIVILGATGSIGTQTVDVIRRLPDRFRLIGASALRKCRELEAVAAEFHLSAARAVCGSVAALEDLASLPEADIVVVAVAGAAGIRATAAALARGADVALATKEVLVAAGEPIVRIANSTGARILPIDSEHSAVFQCLVGAGTPHRIWLTASGGPFREWDRARMDGATVEDALAHPTWPSMGRKITIDSATMMNKGLETIEARWLFDLPVDRIGVVVHPQSVVHSLVEFADGSILAQMGLPDMRLPIQYALAYPDRIDSGLPHLDITALAGPLSFHAPDEVRFPSLALARRAARAGGDTPAVLNAANEAAVSLFLDRKISFPAIAEIVERSLDAHCCIPHPSLEGILEADARTRDFVLGLAGING